MELEVGKRYVCRAGVLRSTVFRVVAKNDNGSVEIQTVNYDKRLTFPLLEIRDEMQIQELP